MLKRTLTPLALMMLILLSPQALLADDHEAGGELIGTWMLKSVEAEGEKEEIPEGAVKVQFLANGIMKSWEEGEESQGTYKVEGDTITISETDGQETETQTFKYVVEGDKLTMLMSLGEGGPEIMIHFAKVNE